MNGFKKGLLFSSLFFLMNTTQALVTAVHPYLGLDYTQAWMKPKNDWNFIFPKKFPGASLYLGAQFHENFALEAGFDWSTKASRSWKLPPAGTPFFGTTIITPIQGTAHIRRTGGHIDLVAFLPAVECFELMASIGYGWVQPKITFTGFSVNPGNTRNSSALASVSGKGKSLFRAGLGAQYMLTEILH